MKTRSIYYEHFELLAPATHAWRMRYWGRELPPTRSGLSVALNERGNGLFQAAVERFGAAYDGGCFCALTSKHRCDEYQCGFKEEADWFLDIFDHAVFFQRPGEPVSAVVGQPYGYHEADHGSRLREFCAERGLEMEVAESWHFPGKATALIFTRAGAPLREGDQELESAFVAFFAKNGGAIDSVFLEVMWDCVRERGAAIWQYCNRDFRQHAIAALNDLNVAPEALPHPFLKPETIASE